MLREKTINASARVEAMYHLMGDEEPTNFVVDLLTDLQHWCFKNYYSCEVDFETALATAEKHFQEEI